MTKKIKKRIIIFLLNLRNNIKRIGKSKEKTIIIASSNKYKNKVKEDLNLEYYILKNGFNAKIKDWQEITSKETILVRSVWGYQNKIETFKEFIENKKTINQREILINNMDKEKQYKIFIEYNLPHIETDFINDLTKINKSTKKLVVKPTISASGENTFIIDEKSNIDDIANIYKNKNIKNLMLQPFIEGIKDGEISVIVINKEIKYAIKRFPGVFTDKIILNYISLNELSPEINTLIHKINEIKEYKDVLYYRLDLVKDQNEYKIIEIEMLDPSLFIETIPNKALRNKIYDDFAKEIIKQASK